MKKINCFLLLALVGFTVSCKTTKSAVSAKEKSETIAQSATRLSSTFSADSLSQWLSLSADSMVIDFSEQVGAVHNGKVNPSPDAVASDDVYFFSSMPNAVAQPSQDGARTATTKPKALKIYGLHVDKNTNKQSVQQSSWTDSTRNIVQSSKRKEENKTKSSPSSAPKYLFYILIIIIGCYIFYRLRR